MFFLLQTILFFIGAAAIGSAYVGERLLEGKIRTLFEKETARLSVIASSQLKEVSITRFSQYILISLVSVAVILLVIPVGLPAKALVTLPLTYVGFRFPGYLYSLLGNRRRKKLQSQLTEGVGLLANALKAGLSLQQAVQMAAGDTPYPLKEEFSYIVGQLKMGRDLGEALSEWARRVRIEDVDILVESILVLRQTGGNLVETFNTIVHTIRERGKVSGRIRVLTAQGVSQAVIILILPFLLAAGIYCVADWYITPLFTTPLGWLFLFVGLGLQFVGGIWLKRIVTIKV